MSLFENATDMLQEANRTDSQVFQVILLNISHTHHAVENYDQAQEYFAQAEEIDPGMVPKKLVSGALNPRLRELEEKYFTAK